MKMFQNLSLTAKLLLSFAVSMVIATWMGYSSLTRMGQMNANTRLIINDALTGASLSGEIEADMRRLRLYEYRHLLETNDRPKLEETMQAELVTIDKLVGEYQRPTMLEEDRQNINELKDNWKVYLEKHEQQLELDRTNNFRAGSALITARYADFNKGTTVLRKMSAWNDKRGRRLAEEANETYASSRSGTLWMLGVFVAVGAGIVAFVWKLGSSFEAAQSALSKVLAKVRAASNSIATGSVQVSAGNAELSTRTEEQAASLEETASSMEEMTSTIKQNADNAKLASQLASQARDVAETGGTVVRDAVTAMGEINDGSKKIADIISVIDEIAFQTNLLALNAAVEAARVGEQGRGFAVVAAEVRNLAGRSATAAKEIKALVQDSVGKVQVGSELVNQSGQRLHEIVESVKKVADIVAEISAASMEQASGVEQVNKAVMQMDKMTQQNAALVEEVSAASQSMSVHAKELQAVVATTKIDDKYELTVHEQTHYAEPREMAATGTHGKVASHSVKPASKLKIVQHDQEFEEF